VQTSCVTEAENPLNVDNDGWTEFECDCGLRVTVMMGMPMICLILTATV
jgi:hypothetical protein